MLLPKRDPVSIRPEEWRPITLLNIDYKVGEAIVVRRLRGVMPSLIGRHQACAVPGNKIHSLSFATRDIMDYARRRMANGIIVCFDQEKAFDRLEHGYIFGVLEAFQFPQTFISLIHNL